jgi:acetoin utilization deacetylase AcuC-like enzyme
MTDYRVGIYDSAVFRGHDAGAGHPERPERLDAIRLGLLDADLEGRLESIAPREATHDELARVHTKDHIAAIAATRGRTVRFDPDTQAGSRSYEAALLAAGAACDAVDKVLDGALDRAFCLGRPPGHHAEAARAMGFCLFNSIAVAAAHALARGLTRVLILDFDVHHGNGTQHIFDDDRRVLYASTHAWPFYPGTGALQETGDADARGFTVNLPMPMGCGDGEYAHVYRETVVPIARAFDPELVLVSAGFDAAAQDPLAGMRVTANGYAAITAACLETASGAANGRAVFVLEGGYNLDALGTGAAAVAAGLLGDEAPAMTTSCSPRFAELAASQRRFLASWWPIG